MQVQCVLCDTIHHLEDNCFEAKRLRNKQGKIYLCEKCNKRIIQRTNERKTTGNFNLYRCENKNKTLLQ